jgi:tetratricopeptide (TPR) repeat protein
MKVGNLRMKKMLFSAVALSSICVSTAFAGTKLSATTIENCIGNTSCLVIPSAYSSPRAGVFKSCGQVQSTRDPDETIRICEKTAYSNVLTPNEKAKALVSLGYAYLLVDLKNSGFSIYSLDRTISTWREATPFLELASLYRVFMKPALAEQAYQDAQLRAPDDWQVYSHHSLSLQSVDQSQAQAQLDLAKRAVTLQPQEPAAIYAEGMALLANNQTAQAIKQLRRAAKNFKSTSVDELDLMLVDRPYVVLASIYDTQHAPARAAQAMTLDMAEHIDFTKLEQRADYYKKAGKLKLAVADLNSAVKIAPPTYANLLIKKRNTILAAFDMQNSADQSLQTGSIAPIAK